MSEPYDFGINSATAEALDDYLALKKPEFAVLINGNWGCGKTWFIRKYFEEFEAKKQSVVQKEAGCEKPATYCYVSLFDVATIAEIDKAILACANPLLKAKDSSFGRLGRAALDQILNRFPVGVTKEDVSAVGTALCNMFSRLPDPLILVLDDLERTKIEMELVLGYISSMLDQNGANVIVLCNEDKMKDDQKFIFQEFKEKVVGTTLTVEPDFEGVYKNAIKITEDKNFIGFLNEHIENIKELFEISKTENLRSIRRIASEFLRFYNFIDKEMRENKEYLKNLLTVIAIFSIEVSKGLSKEELIENCYYIYKSYAFDKISYSREKIEKLKKESKEPNYASRFPFTFYAPISEESLVLFFYYGKMDFSIKEQYIESRYNKNDSKQEVPLRLWDFGALSDEEFNQLYQQMNHELSTRSYTDYGIILHAFGFKIFAAENNLVDSNHDVVEEAKSYIKDIIFPKSILPYARFISQSHSHGFGYYCSDSPQLKEIMGIMREKIVEQAETRLKEVLTERCNNLPEHPQKFIETFPYKKTEFDKSRLILDHLNAEEMARKFLSLETAQMSEVFSCIKYHVESSASRGYIESNNLEYDNGITLWMKNFYDYVVKHSQCLSTRKKVVIRRTLSEVKSKLYPENVQENSHA